MPAWPCLAPPPLPRPQTLRILTSWYLSRWSGAEVQARVAGTSVDRISYIGGYLGFALGAWRAGGRAALPQRRWAVAAALPGLRSCGGCPAAAGGCAY